MSTIKLDSEFSIKIDSQNYTLQLSRSKEITKNGETKTVTESETFYYPDLQSSLRCYLRESLRPCESIRDVLNKIDEVHKTIKGLKV